MLLTKISLNLTNYWSKSLNKPKEFGTWLKIDGVKNP